MICGPEGDAWKERAACERETTWLAMLSGKDRAGDPGVQPHVKEEISSHPSPRPIITQSRKAWLVEGPAGSGL